MGVKKVTKKESPVEEVKVEEVTEVTEVTEEVTEDVEVTETTTEETTEEVTEEPTTEIEVDTKVADVSNAPKDKNVRVKVKKDISFNFGNEKYVMKEGQCYNVPVAVKLHLNKFDALSPL